MAKRVIIPYGLTSAEAATRLNETGPNEIQAVNRKTFISTFVSQFDNFLTILLILAGLVSFLLGERTDSLFIFLIVLLNAAFGVYQEFKAERALDSLRKMTTVTIRVIRDGKEIQIDSRELVPGDVVYLEEGAKVPADGVILDSMHFEVNEAALTGESLPVSKSEGTESREVFMGTIVARGRARIEITQTGNRTRFGSIAKTLESIEKVKTPLQKKLEIFTKQIGIIGITASLLVFGLSFVKEKGAIESFIFAVSLAVAAVPEGLPAVMTITLAIGTERMAKRKAIIRKLNAIEALGSVTVVATDKTGTLTTNRMHVRKLWVDNQLYDVSKPPSLTNHPYKRMLINGIVCSTASLVSSVGSQESDVLGDPTEGALLLLAEKEGMDTKREKARWKAVEEIPFSSTTKRMTVVAKNGSEYAVYSKGAPESILAICDRIQVGNTVKQITEPMTRSIEREFREFAAQGLRMLAFSYKTEIKDEFESNQVFLGFVGIADPIRPEVSEAVEKAHAAGIRVIMITGDNELTAEAVGVEAGIIRSGEDVLSGKQIDEASDRELLAVLDKVRVFARTTPEHKYRLVQLLQKKGEVVTVTGDGVNDALALKQADVGVAMGMTGTDVAKETADMIITDDNFATIINAIEQGRNIYNQIKNAIKYLLACNLGEVIYVICAVAFDWPVMTPLQILYINIATDGLPALCLAFAPNDRTIMHRPPRRLLAILEQHDFRYLVALGTMTAALSYGSIVLFLGRPYHEVSTILFSAIILIQQFILIDLWLSYKPLLRHLRLLLHPAFLLALLFPFVIHPFLLYVPYLNTVFETAPLDLMELTDIIGVTLVVVIGFELMKIRPLRSIFHPRMAT